MQIPPGIQGWLAVLALSLAGLLASAAISLPLIPATNWWLLALAAILALIAWLALPPRLHSEYLPIPPLDEIQFTVYRPKAILPGVWYQLLAFAHLADRRPGALEGEPDPIELVRAQAGQILGPEVGKYRDTSVDARRPVPRKGEITLLPVVRGIEFNPERRIFRWLEDVHREEFRLRAAAAADGTTARGQLMVYLGVILLAEIDLTIRVDSADRKSTVPVPLHADTRRPYRKIFASYSHRDAEIVRQYEALVQSCGDRYLRDVRDLRAGEEWNPRLLELIAEADIFQLFWSTNSMRSRFVRIEWEHALELGRPNFIRPTYWEVPLPESPADGLPPETLRQLHFHWVDTAFVKPRWRPRRRLSSAQCVALGMSLLLTVGFSISQWREVPLPAPFPLPQLPAPFPDRTLSQPPEWKPFPSPQELYGLLERWRRDLERWEQEQGALSPAQHDLLERRRRDLERWEQELNGLLERRRRDLERWEQELNGLLERWRRDLERWEQEQRALSPAQHDLLERRRRDLERWEQELNGLLERWRRDLERWEQEQRALSPAQHDLLERRRRRDLERWEQELNGLLERWRRDLERWEQEQRALSPAQHDLLERRRRRDLERWEQELYGLLERRWRERRDPELYGLLERWRRDLERWEQEQRALSPAQHDLLERRRRDLERWEQELNGLLERWRRDLERWEQEQRALSPAQHDLLERRRRRDLERWEQELNGLLERWRRDLERWEQEQRALSPAQHDLLERRRRRDLERWEQELYGLLERRWRERRDPELYGLLERWRRDLERWEQEQGALSPAQHDLLERWRRDLERYFPPPARDG